MDAKEMNSFHNIVKGERPVDKNNFRVYYFPEIPLEPSAGNERIIDSSYGFQRSKANGETIEDLKKEPDEIEQKAYIEGYAKGEHESLKSSKKMLEPVLNSLRETVLELERVKREIRFNTEKEVIKLALAIANKIVGYEIATKKKVVLSVIREALKKVEDNDKIRVKVNPSDIQVCMDAEFQLAHFFEDTENITFEEDEKVSKGGCVIETNLGDIDARIERQLQVVEEILNQELQKNI